VQEQRLRAVRARYASRQSSHRWSPPPDAPVDLQPDHIAYREVTQNGGGTGGIRIVEFDVPVIGGVHCADDGAQGDTTGQAELARQRQRLSHRRCVVRT
jgi:hypothetical protein